LASCSPSTHWCVEGKLQSSPLQKAASLNNRKFFRDQGLRVRNPVRETLRASPAAGVTRLPFFTEIPRYPTARDSNSISRGAKIVDKNPALPRFDICPLLTGAGAIHIGRLIPASIMKPVSTSPVDVILRSDAAWRSRPPGVQYHFNRHGIASKARVCHVSWVYTAVLLVRKFELARLREVRERVRERLIRKRPPLRGAPPVDEPDRVGCAAGPGRELSVHFSGLQNFMAGESRVYI
jgi:hypothetical protein